MSSASMLKGTSQRSQASHLLTRQNMSRDEDEENNECDENENEVDEEDEEDDEDGEYTNDDDESSTTNKNNNNNSSSVNEEDPASPDMASYNYYSNILANMSDDGKPGGLAQLKERNVNTNSTSSFSSSSNATTNTNHLVNQNAIINANNSYSVMSNAGGGGDSGSVGKSSVDSMFIKKTNTSSSIAVAAAAVVAHGSTSKHGTSSPVSQKKFLDNVNSDVQQADAQSVKSGAIKNTSSISSFASTVSQKFKSDNLPRKTYKSSNMEWCGSQLSLGMIIFSIQFYGFRGDKLKIGKNEQKNEFFSLIFSPTVTDKTDNSNEI
jgi:hypothetical protein